MTEAVYSFYLERAIMKMNAIIDALFYVVDVEGIPTKVILNPTGKTVVAVAIGILVLFAVMGVTIIVNQIKIKKMLRKLSEEKDKP